MSQSNPDPARPAVNKLRLTIAIFVVLAAAGGAYWFGVNSVQTKEVPALSALGMDQPSTEALDGKFKDADGNLVADPPANSADQLDPPKLNFSYLAADQDRYATTWAGVLKFIGERCGRPVEFRPQETPDAQLAGIKSGELHIVGLNSGSVPVAVHHCGFVPLCSVRRERQARDLYDEDYCPKGQSVEGCGRDGRGHRLALTDPTSNSGWNSRPCFC